MATEKVELRLEYEEGNRATERDEGLTIYVRWSVPLKGWLKQKRCLVAKNSTNGCHYFHVTVHYFIETK